MKHNSLTYEEALYKSAAYCSQSEHCISELKNKLAQWNVTESDQLKIIRYLKEEKYLDEKRFAFAYVKDKFRYNKWGKIKIRLELHQKRIEKELIEVALETIDPEEYEEMIIRLAKEKEKKLTYRNEYERKGKLYRFLAGKGFEMDVISRLL
ncbi:Regulatory protein RecX [bioreactor metagenome]|uniref:Regulatory protein RecX n=1 Tax=bioreactor metagenome TaxID=1076179 RepID=A0A644WFC2_9ZZZZ|nr:regulatory protein RecX [Paludibacter sp.]